MENLIIFANLLSVVQWQRGVGGRRTESERLFHNIILEFEVTVAQQCKFDENKRVT